MNRRNAILAAIGSFLGLFWKPEKPDVIYHVAYTSSPVACDYRDFEIHANSAVMRTFSDGNCKIVLEDCEVVTKWPN